MSTHLLEPRTLKELAELLNRLTYDKCNYRAKKAVGNLPKLIRLILASNRRAFIERYPRERFRLPSTREYHIRYYNLSRVEPLRDSELIRLAKLVEYVVYQCEDIMSLDHLTMAVQADCIRNLKDWENAPWG